MTSSRLEEAAMKYDEMRKMLLHALELDMGVSITGLMGFTPEDEAENVAKRKRALYKQRKQQEPYLRWLAAKNARAELQRFYRCGHEGEFTEWKFYVGPHSQLVECPACVAKRDKTERVHRALRNSDPERVEFLLEMQGFYNPRGTNLELALDWLTKEGYLG
jgi:hypothetical protein